ncbi:hypothetical protein [Ramlibacter sp.]|uniref:hypothetical protein n=1 Tax=Ramlibacter sp. TaxID=1917967 RepID=UPI003D0F9CBB
MNDVKVEYVRPGIPEPSAAEIEEMRTLVDQLLHFEGFAGQRPDTVCNALISAYWSACGLAGCQEQAAHGMIQLGAKHIAQIIAARDAAGAVQPAPTPSVH